VTTAYTGVMAADWREREVHACGDDSAASNTNRPTASCSPAVSWSAV
jgi:hypothetical protein